ncbi:hypothetical protein DKT69_37065, partial [Micromonospora sicca]
MADQRPRRLGLVFGPVVGGLVGPFPGWSTPLASLGGGTSAAGSLVDGTSADGASRWLGMLRPEAVPVSASVATGAALRLGGFARPRRAVERSAAAPVASPGGVADSSTASPAARSAGSAAAPVLRAAPVGRPLGRPPACGAPAPGTGSTRSGASPPGGRSSVPRVVPVGG